MGLDWPNDNWHVADLILAEEMFILAHGRRGTLRIHLYVLQAGLAAAALTELHLLNRIELNGAVVRVCDRTPTGDHLLDRVLTLIAQATPRLPYQWVELLALDIEDHIVARLTDRGACLPLPVTWTRGLRLTPSPAELARITRERIVSALHRGDLDGRDVAIGGLLWAVGLAGRVLRGAPISRLYIGRVAAKDWRAAAARAVIWKDMPTPYVGGYGT